MRDASERSSEDRNIVIGTGDDGRPYDVVHWAGQWNGDAPHDQPHTSGDAHVSNPSEPAAAIADGSARSAQAKAAQAGAKARRRRRIALGSGAAVAAILLVMVTREPDHPVISEPGEPIASAPSSPASSIASTEELAEAWRSIEALKAQLRSEADRTEQVLAQGREKAAALEQEAETARRVLADATTQHRQALEQERARGAELASQVLAARQDIETQVAQLRKSGDDAGQLKQIEAARTAQALELEQQKAAALAEAGAARQAMADATEQHRQALDQERQRSAALAGQLAAAQRDNEGQAGQIRKAAADFIQIKQSETARTTQLVQLEQQKAAALAEVEAARLALTTAASQQRQVLEQERGRGAALSNQISSAQREIEGQALQLRKAGAEIAQLKQAETARTAQALQLEQQKAAALAEADTARQALAAATTQHRQALEQERARGAALANQVSAAQRELEGQSAQLRKAGSDAAQFKQAEAARAAQTLQLDQQRAAALAETDVARQVLSAATAQHRQTLEQERARATALAGQLSGTQRDFQAQAEQLRKAQDGISQLRQATDATIAELRQALQQERDRAAAMAQEVSVRPGIAGFAVTGPVTSVPPSRQVPAAQVAEAAPAVVPAVVPDAPDNAESMRLIARASVLLGQGDIGSARIVLERAAEMGSARASFMLAETYDPRILSAWGTYGTRGEVTKARELYARAQAGGIQEAKDRGALLQ